MARLPSPPPPPPAPPAGAGLWRGAAEPAPRTLMATEPAAANPTPTLHRDTQLAMSRRALQRLPGGTDSNFRAWGESTIYVDRGKGALVWDIDGNEYVDLRMGYG